MKCQSCNLEKELGDFYANKRLITGYEPKCKSCTASSKESNKYRIEKPRFTKEEARKMISMLDVYSKTYHADRAPLYAIINEHNDIVSDYQEAFEEGWARCEVCKTKYRIFKKHICE